MSAPSLDLITRGRQEQAPRVLLYSPPKIGKTGWAAQIPGVVFIASEQGTQEYDVARIPVITKCEGKGVKHKCGWSEFHGWLDFLINKPHEFKALAIDTLDWLESVLFTHLIATCPKGRPTIVECHGGYGKGYDVAVDEWRRVASKLDKIALERGMLVSLLAHSEVNKFYDPTSDNFDQHKLKMHKKSAGFWTEWADAIMFANFDILYDQTTDEWTSTGRRVCYTSPPNNFAYVAGNRYGLPPKLDLTYAAFEQAMSASTPKALEAELETILAAMPDEFEYSGSKRTKEDVRNGFRAALDRRTMRMIITAVREIKRTVPQK